MGKHYIPRFYLRRFIESNSQDQIFVYEIRKNKKPFKTNIKNIAQERDYYSDEVEKRLCDEIENPVAPVLNKIFNHQKISIEERLKLAIFMSVFLKRVPRHRIRMNEYEPDIMNSVFSDLYERLNELSEKNPEKKELIIKRRSEAQKFQEEWKKELPKEIIEKVQRPVPNRKIIELLFKMTWIFYTVSEGSKLITSDNPVFFHEGIGLGNTESEISFPLSSNIVLWGSYKPYVEEYYPVKESLIKEFNRRTVKLATRYIFYHKDREWLYKLANKKNIEINWIK